ncbi:hypothetical protein HGA88_03075 [Candidatus Roizmanbacteria bacterium]|nr:hypothetical protein [Candidatus Roizmanbacteria bacterium]
MKAVIFAGGVGTRLWPVSRRKSPKQFEKIVGEKTTLQLAVERLLPEFKPEDIYVSTGAAYTEMVAAQIPFVPTENIIGEPVKKDVGPAVAYVMGVLAKKFPNEPVIILWSDHLVKETKKFKHIIRVSGELVKKDPNKIIFIGQQARFASDNLGWIEMGENVKTMEEVSFRAFHGFKYKPDAELAKTYFASGHHCWNLGYFVSTPQFIFTLFERFAPHIHRLVVDIISSKGKANYNKIFLQKYTEMPEINFDNAVIEQIDNGNALVVVDDIGWSDVGAWEALKEALEKNPDDNVTQGDMYVDGCKDNLIYNYQNSKMIVAVDLDGLLVVNTDDVLLVAKKTSVAKIKKIVENFKGTEHEQLT